MQPGFIAALARAAGLWLCEFGGAKSGERVAIGRDTRESGAGLAQAAASGLRAAGLEPVDLGVVPTPAVALAVRTFGLAGGVVLTASHNPASDNGIKFFDRRGLKLSELDEERVESRIVDQTVAGGLAGMTGLDAETLFIEAASKLLPADSLAGWTVALDAGNGAAYRTSARVLARLGAKVPAIGVHPDGGNINAGCGSQHPEALARLVRETGARLGIAHDGDADRVLLVDESGEICDGDQLLGLLGLNALQKNRLPGGVLVATVQSNLGLDAAMRAAGGRVERTPVGDRHVAEAMLRGGWSLGGENSGHVICAEVSLSGDGLVAALLTIRVLLESGVGLADLRRQIRLFPQDSLALAAPVKPPLESLPRFSHALAGAEAELAGVGRVLARYSGTEPKLRLLVESDSQATNRRHLDRLAQAFRADVP